MPQTVAGGMARRLLEKTTERAPANAGTPGRNTDAACPKKIPRRRSEMKLVSLAASTCALTILIVGCGSSTSPSATEAMSAVSAAEAVGARNDPQAALHLKMAKDQVRAAEALIREGDKDEARLVLERAKVDAELAQVLTREAQMRARAQQAQQEIERLQHSVRP
jgi:hypothetical protein